MKSEAQVREAYDNLGEEHPLKSTLAWVLDIETPQEKFDRLVKESLVKNKYEPKILIVHPRYKGCKYGMPDEVTILVSENIEEIMVL